VSGNSSVVEHHVANVGVASSSLVSRSTFCDGINHHFFYTLLHYPLVCSAMPYYKIYPAHLNSSRPVIIRFLLLFVSLTVILAILSISITLTIIRSERLMYASAESYQISIIHESINKSIEYITIDIRTLVSLRDLQTYCTVPSESNRRHLMHTFSEYIGHRTMYDQIRYIDTKGNEIVQLRQSNGTFETIPDSLHVNRSSYDYFEKTKLLSINGIYISPLTLNTDEGIVEQKPILRFAIPVYDSLGIFHGVMVLDVLGSFLEEKLQETENNVSSHISFLNSDGYWLHSSNTEDEWGFMYADGYDRTFQKRYPDAWFKVNDGESGQFSNDQGLYTYSSIFPLELISTLKSLVSVPDKERYHWLLVLFVPREELLRGALTFVKPFGVFAVFLEVLIIMSSLLYANATRRRNAARAMLEEAAMTDSLTGLVNRRKIKEYFTNEQSRFERNGLLFSLVIADIDHFKLINDTHGHSAGDTILKGIALLFRQSLRRIDAICRWGGEEFVFLLPETDSKHSETVAEKLRQAVSEKVFIHQEIELTITMSFGVAPYQPGQSLEDLIDHADRALYVSKESGRNRVTVWTAAISSPYSANTIRDSSN
jgi:diguanylate cyclase